MANATISRNSFMAFSDLLEDTDEGLVFLDTPDLPEFLPADDDVIIQLDHRYQGRLDLLSFDFYGTTDYWWVIAYINDIDQAPTQVMVSRDIRMPTQARIVDFLNRALA